MFFRSVVELGGLNGHKHEGALKFEIRQLRRRRMPVPRAVRAIRNKAEIPSTETLSPSLSRTSGTRPFASVVFVLMLLTLPVSAFGEDDQSIATLRRMGKAFASIAEKASPAVVGIRATRMVRGDAKSREYSYGDSNPFGEDLFDYLLRSAGTGGTSAAAGAQGKGSGARLRFHRGGGRLHSDQQSSRRRSPGDRRAAWRRPQVQRQDRRHRPGNGRGGHPDRGGRTCPMWNWPTRTRWRSASG